QCHFLGHGAEPGALRYPRHLRQRRVLLLGPRPQPEARLTGRRSRSPAPPPAFLRLPALQGAGEVAEQVLPVLSAYGDADHRIADADGVKLIGTELAVRSGPRMADQRFDAAEADRVTTDLQTPEKVEGAGFSSFDFDRDQ